ncbi:MAG: glycosyl transferase family protein [Rhodospirillales bacterium]
MNLIDNCVLAALFPLAVWILISGLDDFFLDLVGAWIWLRKRLPRPPGPAELARTPERRVAVFVPLWHEHKVIGRMLEHNASAIRYSNYDFIVGAYPNDELTIEAVREASERIPNVHLSICPHDGPTSKADCLNWIYQHMLGIEERTGARYELIVVHDAEDLIHPLELRWLNYYAGEYGMVQIPVLPLPTPARLFTHGVYCDEFAEYQTKDIPARQALGGFIPSNGVGTGYARWALEKLAGENANRIFDPASLTEDYENGLRLHLAGCPQLFVPIQMLPDGPVATREYFPQRIRQALRQRTRWVTGNALQSWERHGWRAGFRQLYWLWRDRKGLFGNPATAVANGILVYCCATWTWSRHTGAPWAFAGATEYPWAAPLLWATLFFQSVRILVRAGCVMRLYGWRLAAGVPLRVFWANWINCAATITAIVRYAAARIRGRPLVWVKTEHMYPSRAALSPSERRLGEILVGLAYVEETRLWEALAGKPRNVRTGEHLVSLGLLTPEQLYEALSLQHQVSFEPLRPDEVPLPVARSLPAALARKCKLVPFKAASGKLHVAGPELPTEEIRCELGKHTSLEIQFQYITPENFVELTDELLGRPLAARR